MTKLTNFGFDSSEHLNKSLLMRSNDTPPRGCLGYSWVLINGVLSNFCPNASLWCGLTRIRGDKVESVFCVWLVCVR